MIFKKIINSQKIIIILIITSLTLTSCVKLPRYEDTNGADDYSLESITEDMFIGRDVVRRFFTSSGTRYFSDKEVYTEKSRRLDGVESIYTFKAKTYEIMVDFIVKRGNARLALVDDDKIIQDFIINKENQRITITFEHTSFLKLAGEDCQYELKLTIFD